MAELVQNYQSSDSNISEESVYTNKREVRPDQLDKVEQIRRKALRSKASIDSRVKTAVQSQLDGIRSGLQELKSAHVEIAQVHQGITDIEATFKECDDLRESLNDLNKVHNQYSKLAKTNDHLKQIFNVPETIEKTRALITNGRYLQAHKYIMELESTRDDLLFDAHKLAAQQGNKAPDQTPLYVYFGDVEKLSDELGKQLWTVISRVLSAAQSNPTQLVTALRIIEREERSDKRAIEQQKKTKFIPPGRPKYWREKGLAFIRKSIDNRFDSNQMELADREDKMWLVRHLERMRAFILADLISVKFLVSPCFPTDYNIFREYLTMYHAAAARTLQDLALNAANSNECVSLLSWVKDYYGPELLGSNEITDETADLQSELGQLLSNGVIESLMDTYVDTTRSNCSNWLSRMIETESADWLLDKEPEKDAEGLYQTSLPIILFQMIDQNLQVAAQIQDQVRIKVLDISIKALTESQIEFKDAIVSFKEKHFEDRSQLKLFDSCMMAIINNCASIMEFAEQMKNQLRSELGDDIFGETREENFKELISTFEMLGKECCGFLVDELFLDLETYLADLLTKKWVGKSMIIDTIICTIEDYSNDYKYLKKGFRDFIMDRAEEQVVIEYLKACMSGRIVYKRPEERRDAATQLSQEAKRIAAEFQKLHGSDQEETPCVVLQSIAEVLKLQDPSMVSLELSGLAQNYPDMSAEHALALISMRGDVTPGDAKQMVKDRCIPEASDTNPFCEGIFTKVVAPTTVMDKLQARFHPLLNREGIAKSS